MNLSKDGEAIMSKAAKEAQRINSPYLSTELILLGFLKSKDRISREVVQARANYDEVVGHLAKIVPMDTSYKGDLPTLKTPRAEETLEIAERRAMETGSQVEPIHLFLGLMASGGEQRQGMVHRLLRDLEINPDEWAQEAEAAASG